MSPHQQANAQLDMKVQQTVTAVPGHLWPKASHKQATALRFGSWTAHASSWHTRLWAQRGFEGSGFGGTQVSGPRARCSVTLVLPWFLPLCVWDSAEGSTSAIYDHRLKHRGYGLDAVKRNSMRQLCRDRTGPSTGKPMRKLRSRSHAEAIAGGPGEVLPVPMGLMPGRVAGRRLLGAFPPVKC